MFLVILTIRKTSQWYSFDHIGIWLMDDSMTEQFGNPVDVSWNLIIFYSLSISGQTDWCVANLKI